MYIICMRYVHYLNAIYTPISVYLAATQRSIGSPVGLFIRNLSFARYQRPMKNPF